MEKRVRLLIIVLFFVAVIQFTSIGLLYVETTENTASIEELRDSRNEITSHILYGGEFSTGEDQTVRSYNGSIVAYSPENGGTAIKYELQPLPTDKVYVNIRDEYVTESFQNGVNDALYVAQNSRYDPRLEGFALTLNTPSSWEYISGESAGLPIAMQIAATDKSVKMKEGVVLTGRLERKGGVLAVERVEQKAQAAKSNGATMFITPYTKSDVNVNGIEVVQVGDFETAAEHALVSAN